MNIVRSRCLLLILLYCLLAAASLPAVAQPDTRGQEFYLTFPPNFHNNLDNPQASLIDSLYIFIAATEPTTGQIAYRDIDNNAFVVNYSITDPSQVYTFGIPWIDFELRGFNDSGTLISYHQSASIAPQSFRITSSKDVAVYALNRAETTSDAMLVLPTDVLGTKYRVMAYNSDFRGNEDMDTPSQLAVVATRDNTVLTIQPTVPVMGSTLGTITVRLNAGNSYLLQAAPGGQLPDLTGTLVESTQPVAVFGGHQRTRLPVQDPSMNSRDYLIEQIPPIDVWGKSYILTPFPPPDNQQEEVVDIVRVLAANDNTQVFIADELKATLAAGEVYEELLQTASLLTASENVLVAQYKQTSRDGGNLRLADPFMIIVPPRKQFLQSYLCINAQSYADKRIYFRQYMTLICHKNYVASMTIDGAQVNAALFKDIPGTCYTYAWVPTSDGSHHVEGQNPFGLYVYGYGTLDSYGYTGGMAFHKEDEDFVHVSSDTVLCTGDSLQLSITGGTSYSWSPANGLSCTDCANPVAKPQTATTYNVSFTDAFGCEHKRSIAVDVQPYPKPVVSSDTTMCSGQSVVLKASGGRFYQWSPSSGLSCTDCASPTANPTKTTTYTVVISNGGTCFATDSVTVAVRFAPIDALPSDTLMCTNDSIAFHLPAEGFSYKWTPATGLSCTDCPNPIARPTKTTKYIVVMTNDAGCKVAKAVTVTVVALPIVNITRDLTLCSNDPPVRLLAKGGNYYQWSPADGLSCTDCASPLAKPSATTTYTVHISITNTCAATTTVTITVPPTPVPDISTDTTVCLNTAVQLHASGGTTYAWSPADGLSCTTCPDPLALPQKSTLYRVAIANDEGCSVEDSVQVTVISPADISVSPDVEVCRGSSASLSASGGSAYQWSPADGLSCTDCPAPEATPNETTIYTVVITGSGGCMVERSVAVTVLPAPQLVVGPDASVCRGQSTVLQASGGVDYEWWPATSLSCSNCSNPTATPTSTTQYYVRASNGSCSQIDSVMVTVAPCNLKAEFSTEEFPPLLLCNSAEGRCVFRNTGEDPIIVTSWQISEDKTSSFVLRELGLTPPYTLAPSDSLVFGIGFQPQQTGSLSALLTITVQDAPVFTQKLSGEGYKRTLSLSLGPDIYTTIGDTIALHIVAACDNWSEAQISKILLDITYPIQWLAYSGTATAIDPSWQVSAAELPGADREEKTLHISVEGSQPLTANGTVATVYIIPFLTTQQVYTPRVSASAPDREVCVATVAEANSIDLTLCVPHLRPIRYSGSAYKFEIAGGTAASGEHVHVYYGVALQAHSTIELYDCLGQLLRTIDLGTLDAGDYRHEIEMQNLSRGMYIMRYKSGPYSRSIPFLFGAE